MTTAPAPRYVRLTACAEHGVSALRVLQWPDTKRYFVKCYGCFAQGPACDDVPEAIEGWNAQHQRTPDAGPAPEAVLHAMEDNPGPLPDAVAVAWDDVP